MTINSHPINSTPGATSVLALINSAKEQFAGQDGAIAALDFVLSNIPELINVNAAEVDKIVAMYANVRAFAVDAIMTMNTSGIDTGLQGVRDSLAALDKLAVATLGVAPDLVNTLDELPKTDSATGPLISLSGAQQVLASESGKYRQALTDLLERNATLERVVAARDGDSCDTPASGGASDKEMLDWLDQNIFHRQMEGLDAIRAKDSSMWVLFAPRGAQGSARAILAAAMRRDNAERDMGASS